VDELIKAMNVELGTAENATEPSIAEQLYRMVFKRDAKKEEKDEEEKGGNKFSWFIGCFGDGRDRGGYLRVAECLG
jgi:hypothetical protein